MIQGRPLRIVIPAFLLVGGLLLAAGQFYAELRSRQVDLVRDIAERAASLGNREVANIEYALSREDLDAANLQVALLVSEPDLHVALLVDDGLNIIQATRGEFRSRAFRETPASPGLDLLERARSVQVAQFRLAEDTLHYDAAFPVQLHLKAGELRSTRVGALYLDFDLSERRASAWADSVRHMAWETAILLGMCLFAGWFLQRVVAGRVSTLLSAVNRLARGETQVRADVAGSDELAGLATGFNEMAATLEHRDEALRKANAELSQSEERFRQVVENISEVFWIVDPVADKLLYMSPSYERIWGRSSEPLFAFSRAWLETIHVDDRVRVARAFKSQSEFGAYDEIYRIVRPDGSQRWIRDRGFPLRNEADVVFRIVGVAEDITERRELEMQFHQAQKLEAVGRLAGGIAHDFNNLLAAILGNAKLALADLGSEDPAVESVREIQRAGERARSLVQQILIFNRGQPQARQVVDFGQIVREAGSQVGAALPAGARLDIRVDPALPNVLGHATRLHQIVLNLLTNASHALEGKPGTIDVSLTPVEVDSALARRFTGLAPGQAVRLTIVDTGRGMDQATLNRIFEPFFTTREVGHGTGLGLALAYAIVQEHQGAIDVRSEPGKGSTFNVYLPSTALAVKESVPKAVEADAGHGERILYLDDDEALVSLTTRALRRLGYQVTGFQDQEEALRHLTSHPTDVDVFVTDYNMPGLSGLEVAQKALQIRPELPVLLMSGYVTEALVRGATQLGVRQVLEKPGGVEALTDEIHAALQA